MPELNPTEIFSKVLAERSTHLADVQRHLREDEKTIVLEMLPGSALPLMLAELLRSERRPMLILTAGIERAEDIAGDLEFFGVANAMHYPKWEVLPYDEDDLSLEATAKTLDVFEAIERRRGDAKAAPFAIVAPVDALMQKVLPAQRLKNLTVRIKWGDRLDLGEIGERLSAAGYEREPLVEARGEFSIRGGIVDIFPLNSENPVRIDLFGDEIESIRTFDVSTQRSLADLGTDAELIIAPSHLKAQVMEFLKSGDGAQTNAKTKGAAPGNQLETLFDHLPPDTIMVLESPERFAEVCSYFESAVERQYETVGKSLENSATPDALIMRPDDVPAAIARFRRIEYSASPAAAARNSSHVKFEQTNYVGDTSELDSWLAQIKKFQQKDFLVAVVCDNDGQVQRFEELLREKEIGAVGVYASGWSEGFELKNVLRGHQDVLLMVGAVQTGFALPDARLCLMTDREIFGRYKRRFVYKKIYKGKPIHSSNEIRRGDYVVHTDHGIGKFLGMRVQELDGRMVDLIEIEYANNDKLLVPVEKIHKIQKYSAHEGLEPNLDRLGSNKWAKRREKHSAEIEALAEELLKLYANRQLADREPHEVDTRLQLEFESSFLYQETPDQMSAIVDTKKDMEKRRPMDRLICGDVGYGKTEVAIRAIFKAVQSGRQAAVLCPTTILAQQHFNNFRERFADYPVRLEMISRFRKPHEVKDVKARLKTGEVDVVVGTHALLAKDVSFKNLGLVVVDEEQRFGVKAKERLKEMRTEIDILTLSATPIPRTLHLALSGLRDLSLITTPPPDRQPIKTKIIAFEEAQIGDAILRELNRGGQVYFVHNRVATIEEVMRRLKEIVPHARITYAHGQMDEEQLEETMIKFIDRQFDILVSTTIIESGVDIPNCNTIIINRADAFGLSQLYQLRGRVGREKRRAYAYLIVPQGRAITESAIKRLAAIEEFAELGVGFSIAMRDLEIRGAGDILGKAQHGAISEIGFELFCELLEERVRERRGDLPSSYHEVDLKWDANAFFPPTFIPMEAQRVTFYKRLASARSMADLEETEKEIRDRYGAMPEAASNLVQTYGVRMASQPHHVGAVRKNNNKIRLTLISPEAREREDAFRAAAKKDPRIVSASAETFDQIVLTLKPEVTPQDAFGLLRSFFAELPVATAQNPKEVAVK